MTFKELFEKFTNESINAIVTIKKAVFEDMYFADKGMKGIVVGIDNRSNELTDEEKETGMYVLKVNCDQYREANKCFLEYNYFDSNKKPTLNAEEAGFYPKNGIEGIYVMGNQTVEEFFDIEFVAKDFNRKENIKQFLLNYLAPHDAETIDKVVDTVSKM